MLSCKTLLLIYAPSSTCLITPRRGEYYTPIRRHQRRIARGRLAQSKISPAIHVLQTVLTYYKLVI